jgi:hypothetical protein
MSAAHGDHRNGDEKHDGGNEQPNGENRHLCQARLGCGKDVRRDGARRESEKTEEDLFNA